MIGGMNVIFLYFMPFDVICYEYLYKISWMNGRPSDDAYKLNYYHNYNFTDNEMYFKCHHCISGYHDYTNQAIYNNDNSLIYGYDDVSILKCGHAFHSECLRRYEKFEYIHNTFDKSVIEPYKCPVNGCKRMYDWRDKWDYKYIDNKVFDEMRDETLLKYIPRDIENIIIRFMYPK